MVVVLSLAVVPVVRAFPAGADDFANSPLVVDLGKATENGVSVATDLLGFDSETNEPSLGFFAARRTAWWRWTAPETGFCTVDTRLSLTQGSGMRDTSVGVFTGTAVNALTQVAVNDTTSTAFGPDPTLARVSFYAVAGVTYHFVVDASSAGSVAAGRSQVVLRVRLLPLKTAVRTMSFYDPAAAQGDAGSRLGLMTLTTNSAASFSGKCTLGGKTMAFKGAFNADGSCRITVPQKKPPQGTQPLPVTLEIVAAGSGEMTVLYPDGHFFASEFPEKAVFANAAANTLTGYYTARVENGLAAGYLTLTVKANGTASGACVLPDGTATTLSVAMHDRGEAPNVYQLPFYKSLYGSKGGINGILRLVEGGADDSLESDGGQQVRPASATSAFFAGGLNRGLDFLGGTYRPAAFTTFLGNVDELSVTGFLGELDVDVVEPLDFVSNQFVFNSLARKPSLKLNLKTGVVTGGITAPLGTSSGTKRTLRAILCKNLSDVFLTGFASGRTRTLRVEVTGP